MLARINPDLGAELEQKRQDMDSSREIILDRFIKEKAGAEIKENDKEANWAHATAKDICENPPDVSRNPEQHAKDADLALAG